jgi:small subunit ribosomal protein S21
LCFQNTSRTTLLNSGFLASNLRFGRIRCLIIDCSMRSHSSRKEVSKQMAYISVNNNESIESALRRFKRKVISEEIIKDLKKHAHFIPPGQKAKLKSVNARKRNRRRFRQQRPTGTGAGAGAPRPGFGNR